MSNKKSIYILIPFVIIVWGYIIYRVYDARKSAKVINPSQIKIPVANDNESEEKNTFTIKGYYGNVFKTGSTENEYFEEKQKDADVLQIDMRNRLNEVKNIKPVYLFPEVVYYGIVENKKSRQNTGIARWNNRDKLITEQELIDGVKIQGIYKDSLVLTVENDNIKKVIRKTADNI